MGDLGAVAISWPNESTKSGFVVANGLPMQLGVTNMRPNELGYRLDGWVGNLTTVVVGNCQVQASLTRGRQREFSTIAIPGYFSPGESLDFSMQVPAKLRGAEQITLSRMRCADAFYIDKDSPGKGEAPIITPRPQG